MAKTKVTTRFKKTYQKQRLKDVFILFLLMVLKRREVEKKLLKLRVLHAKALRAF